MVYYQICSSSLKINDRKNIEGKEKESLLTLLIRKPEESTVESWKMPLTGIKCLGYLPHQEKALTAALFWLKGLLLLYEDTVIFSCDSWIF